MIHAEGAHHSAGRDAGPPRDERASVGKPFFPLISCEGGLDGVMATLMLEQYLASPAVPCLLQIYRNL